MYFLGVCPLIILPFNHYTYRSYYSGATHAVIYSQSIRKKIYNLPYIPEWDLYIKQKFIDNVYIYYIPLVLQTFTETENKSNWLSWTDNNILKNTIMSFFDFTIGALGLNNQMSVENGFNILYFISKFLVSLIVLIILFIFYCIIKSFLSTKTLNNLYKKIRYILIGPPIK